MFYYIIETSSLKLIKIRLLCKIYLLFTENWLFCVIAFYLFSDASQMPYLKKSGLHPLDPHAAIDRVLGVLCIPCSLMTRSARLHLPWGLDLPAPPLAIFPKSALGQAMVKW